jgi:tryptophanyl-tRNA synthetase
MRPVSPSTAQREVVLTGDRPRGPLDLGHFAGSLRTRLALQYEHDQTILIADLQALTDNAGRPVDARRQVASDPGRVEGNVVIAYLGAFDPNRAEVQELKTCYRVGGLGDTALKRRFEEVLESLLAPIRASRSELAEDPAAVEVLLRTGTAHTQEAAAAVLHEGRAVFTLDRPPS